jgi:hypothetical protein
MFQQTLGNLALEMCSLGREEKAAQSICKARESTVEEREQNGIPTNIFRTGDCQIRI